ncbi:proliferating cell nuclear antigen (pcna) [Candidatus Woesearchaeota archaeon]|nr:proliferating cell nuclear antigen (pcna) [Candidatus Woesearchaeota archaeon]
MKLVLTEPRYLKDSILIISELVNEVNLKLYKDRIELVAMDPANVAMVIFKLLSSAFSEYNIDQEKTIGVNLINLTQILKRVKPTDMLILEVDSDKNKLIITLKGVSTKRFELGLLNIDEREQKVPNLSFSAKVETNTLLFNDAIEDMEAIGDSLSFQATNDRFLINSEGNISSGNVEIGTDEDTTIDLSGGPVDARYSIEYLKKIIKGSKLANKVNLEFAQNYPLRVEYKVLDKLALQFVLAPRTPTE